MHILLTGATGYIGKRLLPVLVQKGHHVTCCVRDPSRFEIKESVRDSVSVLQCDLLDTNSLSDIPDKIDAAYYLVHSMSATRDYADLELKCATNFRQACDARDVRQVIYLSGMVNANQLSPHLESRLAVEEELATGNYALTTLRAGIVIGSGSASFEIIRDLVEKLPVMIAPKWLRTKCQPIAIADVITALHGVLGKSETYARNFDIGGPDVLTYKQMLTQFAEVRQLKRSIFIVPVMTPRLSSYWLYFVTSTSYTLAVALVNSMKVDVVSRSDEIHRILNITPLGYKEALERAFDKIQSNNILSSWKDSLVSGTMEFKISDFISVPEHGCFVDKRRMAFKDKTEAIQRLWGIGGQNGWYYANILWRLRGLLDKFVGGVGLRRGRTSPSELHAGDALDFWRVLYADREKGRLLLFAEMKLPGEAWLEFCIENKEVVQTATFRPRGVLGRLYWYAVLPFHGLVFNGLLKALTK